MTNQKGFVWLPILLGILGLVILGGGAYWHEHRAQSNSVVYCNGEILTGADSNTFTILSGAPGEDGEYIESYAKDSMHAYYDCASIAGADAETFNIIGKPSIPAVGESRIGYGGVHYAKDKNHVYFDGKIILDDIDPATFSLITAFDLLPGSTPGRLPPNYYGKDKDHVFDGAQMIIKANPESFHLICHDAGESPQYACQQETQLVTPPTTVGASQLISVSAMNKYTDTDFGFSFWYPSGWSVQSSPDYPYTEEYGVSTKELVVSPNPDLSSSQTIAQGITVTEYSSPTREISDSTNYCSIGATGTGICNDILFYFDVNSHTWMQQYPAYMQASSKDDTEYFIATSTGPADVTHNTMGGLHMLSSGDQHHWDIIVPLNAHNFVVVGGYSNPQPNLAKTIVATDPTVATPVSAAEQIKIIQAEKDAYANQ